MPEHLQEAAEHTTTHAIASANPLEPQQRTLQGIDFNLIWCGHTACSIWTITITDQDQPSWFPQRQVWLFAKLL